MILHVLGVHRRLRLSIMLQSIVPSNMKDDELRSDQVR